LICISEKRVTLTEMALMPFFNEWKYKIKSCRDR
jgi:hypothetical protein